MTEKSNNAYYIQNRICIIIRKARSRRVKENGMVQNIRAEYKDKQKLEKEKLICLKTRKNKI